ncbi:MAG: 4a-hydroxytetrahydrobiopterin dehydratase [Acidobacteria bacterium]|nr:4a-hydroxytetrahydrobiopterin dehydratase [Acidobacteriota bacterium]
MERRKLETQEIAKRLGKVAGWTSEDDFLKKRFEFGNFAESLAFVNAVGEIAERHDHHPDITFGWGYAEISLTTHDRGGITNFDFAVATEIEQI